MFFAVVVAATEIMEEHFEAWSHSGIFTPDSPE
jgi:hypothetical protein